jgi:hypothetical protein
MVSDLFFYELLLLGLLWLCVMLHLLLLLYLVCLCIEV